MKRIIYFILFLLISTVANSQTISGRVVDKISGNPLEDAFIRVIETGQVETSKTNGSFKIKISENSFETKDVKLVVSYIGYQTKEIAAFSNNKTIELEKSSVNLSEIIISSGKNINPFSNISKIDLNTQPVTSSQDILRVIPGLFIGQHQGGGKAEQIFMRGFDIDHGTDISISVDGLPVNMVSHAHGQGYADLHFVIPELVDKADYGKGTYNTRYGNFATAGYADLKTKQTLDKSTVKIEGGEFNTVRTVALLNLLGENQRSRGTNAYIASEFLYSDGPFESPAHFNRFNIFGRYNTKFNNNNKLSITLSNFNSRWNASGQIPERAVNSGMINRFGAIDNTEGGYTGRTNADVKLTSYINNRSTIENQFYYTKYHFNLNSNFTFYLNDPVNGDQIRQREGRDIFGYKFNIINEKDKNGWQIHSEYGAGFRFDKTKNSELSNTINKNEVLSYVQLGDISELNSFLITDKSFSKSKWTFNFGGRLDQFQFGYYDDLKSEKNKRNPPVIFSPKLNIQYAVNQNTHLYIKAGKGFHSNDTRVIIANTTGQVLPAAYGSDIGVFIKPLPSLIINAAIWYLHLDQEFVYVGDAGIVEPSGKTRRTGIDVVARYQFKKWLFADFNINMANPRSTEGAKGNNFIPLAPTLTSTGGIAYKLENGLNGSLRYRYMKNRAANEDNSVIAKGYTVADLSLSYTAKKYEIGFTVENLFNTVWNETQFNTESRLKNEPQPVEEIHFTPGTPFFAKLKFSLFF